MSGINSEINEDYHLEEMSDLDPGEQANKFVSFYAATRNKFKSVSENDIPDFDFGDARQKYDNILTTPDRIKEVICSMNKRAACIQGDIPLKIFSLFADYLTKPLCNIFNSMFISSEYPEIWKTEFITPAAKCYPPTKIKHFRPISGLLNCAKMADKIMASYIVEDMERDKMQYGNEKGLSINHYLVNMINKILVALDKNNNFDKNAVILSMFDWSGAFENQSHILGLKSFIKNYIRPSLIPIFSKKKIKS